MAICLRWDNNVHWMGVWQLGSTSQWIWKKKLWSSFSSSNPQCVGDLKTWPLLLSDKISFILLNRNIKGYLVAPVLDYIKFTFGNRFGLFWNEGRVRSVGWFSLKLKTRIVMTSPVAWIFCTIIWHNFPSRYFDPTGQHTEYTFPI